MDRQKNLRDAIDFLEEMGISSDLITFTCHEEDAEGHRALINMGFDWSVDNSNT
jgi:hypothetical protein